MIALLEQQHVGRRPLTAGPAVRPISQRRSGETGRGLNTVRSWERTQSESAPTHRRSLPPPARRGSERLDELMRHQSPGRSGERSRRAHRDRVEEHGESAPRRAREETHAAARFTTRVRRPGKLALALGAAAGDARAYLAEQWRLWVAVAGAAVALLGMLAVLARLAPARVPEISFAAAESPGEVLRSALVPEGDNEQAPMEPAVIRILSVRQHEVKAGETLSEIAERYGLRLGTLINFNAITDARNVAAGRKLQVPNADGLRYTVRRGDSLGKIAARYDVSLNALRDWNDLRTDVIKSGQQLFVPGGRLTEDEINAVLGKLFIYPTRGQFTSGFGMRVSPFTGVEILHTGIDIANRTGTPITASRAGKVTLDFNPTYGRVVILSHGGGYQTMYAHLDTVLVRSGQTVTQGQQIGTMGSTGQALGSHLHFTVYRNGSLVDPLSVLH